MSPTPQTPPDPTPLPGPAAHPRRSAANRRSWREARNQQRSPAPGFDPQWINNRKDGPQ